MCLQRAQVTDSGLCERESAREGRLGEEDERRGPLVAHGAAALGVAELDAHSYFAEDVFEVRDQMLYDVDYWRIRAASAASKKERHAPGAF